MQIERYPFEKIMIYSAQFNRRQEGGSDSNQVQIQNFSLSQSDCILIADTTSFSKKKTCKNIGTVSKR